VHILILKREKIFSISQFIFPVPKLKIDVKAVILVRVIIEIEINYFVSPLKNLSKTIVKNYLLMLY